jgi:outer membrane protein assembly factor BamA
VGPFRFHLEGSLTTLTSANDIPLSERLFLDGSRDVRGFAPGGIGPIGGSTTAAIGHASLELPTWGGVSLEGFVDHARLDRAIGTSTGFGVLWRSPIGPLHVDLAFPLGGAHPALIFGIGGVM